MSLRLRLIGLVAIVLVISLALGSVIACFNASGSVGTEMRSALLLGRRVVENAAGGINTSDHPDRDLHSLVSVFAGDRHLRASLAGDPAAVALPAVEKSPFGTAPAWFARLIGVPSMSDRIPIAVAGRSDAVIVLDADAHNETLDVWNDFNDTVIVLLLFSGQTIVLIYLFIGRALRPLYRLTGALEAVGQGNYGTVIGGRLAPELSRLRDSFNRMAGRLAAADTDNRRLNEQLLTLQERERGEIARDLHDEVGPYLFAINIDTAGIARLIEEGRAAEASGHLPLITEAVEHVQHELRGIVRRLRPVGLTEFGLEDAIGDMIEFWRRRHPDVEFRVAIGPDCEALGELLDTTIYRIVQECLTNALRHGQPTIVSVSIERALGEAAGRDQIMLEISDDGPGLTEAAGTGFGLRGMAERVRAIGGSLAFRSEPGDGLMVSAALPCRRESDLAGVAPGEGGP